MHLPRYPITLHQRVTLTPTRALSATPRAKKRDHLMENAMVIRSVLAAAAAFTCLSIGCAGVEPPDSKEGATSISAGLTLCQDIEAKLAKLRPQVTACNPAGSAKQCQLFLDDICCPLTANGGPVEDFKQLVQDFKDAKCTAFCPAIACRLGPTGKCNLSGECDQL